MTFSHRANGDCTSMSRRLTADRGMARAVESTIEALFKVSSTTAVDMLDDGCSSNRRAGVGAVGAGSGVAGVRGDADAAGGRGAVWVVASVPASLSALFPALFPLSSPLYVHKAVEVVFGRNAMALSKYTTSMLRSMLRSKNTGVGPTRSTSHAWAASSISSICTLPAMSTSIPPRTLSCVFAPPWPISEYSANSSKCKRVEARGNVSVTPCTAVRAIGELVVVVVWVVVWVVV